MKKALYKPVNFGISALGGFLAGQAFKLLWRRVSGDEDAPEALDRDYTWAQIVVAAAVQGAIFGAVKAATERAGAVGYRKATGDWPGD